ncbi:RNA-directed DNA polymerase, eukaryota, reverse transcriptase zinc-binding domain protein [Tanacetum coccineum]
MTPNRRKLKHRIKPPKRYEGSVFAFSKRNDSDQDTSNDENSKEDMGNKAMNVDEGGKKGKEIEENLGGNGLEIGEIKENVPIIDKTDINEGINKNANDKNPRTYANMVKNDEVLINKNLIFIAPKVTEDGVVIVLFDEEIVNKGCVKWQFTICGYFIRQNMSFYELRYHVRRMWGKFALKDVIVNATVRPLFVQKWDPEIGMVKTKPSTLPIWVKLINIPMEGWSIEGISALSCSLGKPMVMDEMTANMCQYGVGRSDCARVLVGVEAKKELKDVIKIEYIGKNKHVKGTKEVAVMYDWKPECCSYCNVFGHCLGKFNMRPRIEEGEKERMEASERAKKSSGAKQTEIFIEVQHRKRNVQNQRRNWQTKNQWEIDRLKEQEDQGTNVEDVYENEEGIAQTMTVDNVSGNEEHSNGGSSNSNDMQDFIDCVNTVEMEDLCSNGFPDANALFLPYLVSDHSLVVVKFPQRYEKKIKHFRFANYIVEKEEFLPAVTKGWNIEVQGYKMFQLIKKMKALKSQLNYLNWKNGNLYERVQKCKDDLKEYNKALKNEETLLSQKAKVDWISKRDSNNQYFHKFLKSKRQASKIVSICDDQGKRLEGTFMEEQFVNHFQRFLSARKDVNNQKDFEGVFGTKLNNAEAIDMVKEITDLEIKNAMFDIRDNKAPGPDGYASTFYKKTWKFVGKDVCMAIKEFFNTGKLLGEMNATLISLVPKVSTQNKVSDYRPIASCNVVYKCISKILTDRIKPGLHKLKHAKFKFHMGIKELRLTHLCFDDDLLVVCHGDVELVRIVKDTLMEFIGKLPVKYLGVPLITKKLSSKECKKLIDKEKDVTKWKDVNGKLTDFSSKVVWEVICTHNNKSDMGTLGMA